MEGGGGSPCVRHMRPFSRACNSLHARSLALRSGIQLHRDVPSSASRFGAKLWALDAGPQEVMWGRHQFDHLLPPAAVAAANKGAALRALRAKGAYQNALPWPGVHPSRMRKSDPKDSWLAPTAAPATRMAPCAFSIYVSPL